MKKVTAHEEQHHEDGYAEGHYPDDYPGDGCDGAPMPTAMTRRPTSMYAPACDMDERHLAPSGNNRHSRKLARATEETVELTKSAAYVAHVAMDLAAGMSMKEEFLNSVAPSGKERYKAIADAFAERVSRQLRGRR